MGKSRKKHFIIRRIILGMLIIIIIAGGIYCRFGGFGTGKSADIAEFAKYAGQVSDITIPEETRIIALGEATSHDPLAKAAKKCGYDICWLDFSKIPEASALKPEVVGYCYMGNFGENQMTILNRIIMRAIPYTYRIWGSPASMYDGMIFVTEAHPIQLSSGERI